MALIDWDDAFSVGVTQFDEEHQVLIGLINRVAAESERAQPDEDTLGEILADLNGYAVHHFAEEEAFLRKIGFAGFTAHKQAHDAFIQRIHDLCVDFSCGNLGVVVQDLVGYLSHWLINHILRADMAYRTVIERRATLIGRLTGGRLSTRHTSLRVVAYSAIAVLLLAILAGFGRLSWMAWDDRAVALDERETTQIANLLLRAGGQWAVERGATAGALAAADPAPTETRDAITARREKADAAFEQARAALAAVTRPAAAPALARALAAYTVLQNCRREVDLALARPLAERGEAVRKAWFPTITAAIEASQELRQTAKSVDDHAQSELTALDQAKHFVWVMSEYAGRERAQINAVLASGKPLSPPQLAVLGGFRGRVDLGWEQLQGFLRLYGDDFPAITAAAATVEATFLGRFQQTRDAVYSAGTANQPYPVDGPEWMAQATAAIDSILALNDAITGAALIKADQTALESSRRLVLTLAIMAATFGVGALSFLTIRGRITRPITDMTAAMERLANGQLDVAVTPRQDDEIGKLARMLIVFRQNAQHGIHMQNREKHEFEQRETRRQRIETATERFDKTILAMLEKIRSAVEHLHASADSLSANAEQTQRQSAAVSAATEQATANVETVSAAGIELMASIREISSQVERSVATAQGATREAIDTNRKVAELAVAAGKINHIVGLINTIASQTNLLALNATIESARAGEAGKGFAVVAGEVKNLSGQTSRATDEIAGHIAAVQTETRSAIDAIGGIARTIERINEMATAIAGAVEEQGAATAEIARNVEHASAGTREVANNIAGVAAAAAETGVMAHGVFQAASGLLAESESLEHEVERFLADVRAA